MQSLSPSQTNPKEMHSPLVTHLNSCEVHDGDAATDKQLKGLVSCFIYVKWIYKMETGNAGFLQWLGSSNWLQYSRQFSSSESSVQSFVPSHLQAMLMHCPLLHWNSELPQFPAENRKKDTIFKSSSLQVQLVWFQLQRSFTYFIWFKIHSVALLNVRCCW